MTAVYSPEGDVIVYFGTGDPTTSHAGQPAGAFYALVDSKVLGDEVRLLDSGDGDWPIQFSPNEALAGEPVVVNGVLYFTTYYPSASECYLGNGRLYAVQYMTGEGRFQTNPDHPEMFSKYVELGAGIPSSVVVGYDRWYVAMNNAAVGEGSDGGINAGGPEDVSGAASSVKTFYGELRPFAWVEGASH
jgi:hypothetical protein